MKLRELITEASVGQAAGAAAHGLGKVAGIGVGLSGLTKQNIDDYKTGYKAVTEPIKSLKSAKKAEPKAKPTPYDSVSPVIMKQIIEKVLSGKPLAPNELQTLERLKNRL